MKPTSAATQLNSTRRIDRRNSCIRLAGPPSVLMTRMLISCMPSVWPRRV